MPTVPPLLSGGVMLTYRCTNACKHCGYRCSPARPDHFMTEEMIDRTFAALARERSLHGVHLAGGEATLNWKRLEYAIQSAYRHGVNVDYLETNVAWCDDYETARTGFERLERAGLNAVLISASLFHNEFTPLEKTKAGIQAAQDVFGRYGVIVWTPEVLRLMERLDPGKTHPLKRSCELLGLDPKQGAIWRVHNYLTPGGRTTEKLTEGVARLQAEEFAGQSCRATLESTSHFPYRSLWQPVHGQLPWDLGGDDRRLSSQCDGPIGSRLHTPVGRGGPIGSGKNCQKTSNPTRKVTSAVAICAWTYGSICEAETATRNCVQTISTIEHFQHRSLEATMTVQSLTMSRAEENSE